MGLQDAWLPVQVTIPLLKSEYGKDYDYEAPVKLLDRMMHSLPTSREQQVRSHTGQGFPWLVWLLSGSTVLDWRWAPSGIKMRRVTRS